MKMYNKHVLNQIISQSFEIYFPSHTTIPSLLGNQLKQKPENLSP